MSSVDVKRLFEEQHSVYKMARPTYPEELYQRLMAAAQVEVNTAWDCGCGSGQAAHDLARHVPRVVATDVSGAQIKAASPHARVSYHQAGAEDVSAWLDDASVELVCAATAFHWFDEDAFYQETWRVLRPGGVLGVWSYAMHHVEQGEAVNAWTTHFVHTILHTFWQPQNHALMRDEYRLAGRPAPDAREVSDAIFLPKLHAEQEVGLEAYAAYLRSWSASQRFAEVNGEDPVELHREALEQSWVRDFGDVQARAHVRWPLFGRAFLR